MVVKTDNFLGSIFIDEIFCPLIRLSKRSTISHFSHTIIYVVNLPDVSCKVCFLIFYLITHTCTCRSYDMHQICKLPSVSLRLAMSIVSHIAALPLASILLCKIPKAFFINIMYRQLDTLHNQKR